MASLILCNECNQRIQKDYLKLFKTLLLFLTFKEVIIKHVSLQNLILKGGTNFDKCSIFSNDLLKNGQIVQYFIQGNVVGFSIQQKQRI